jgi:hypothetical protein
VRIEVTRAIADWLMDAQGLGHGVNTFVQTVPVDSGDDLPPQIAPYADPKYPASTIAVFDDTRHLFVINREEPPVWPAIYVMSQGKISMQGMAWPNGFIRQTMLGTGVELAIRYITNQGDWLLAKQQGEYTLRAVVRSLQILALDAPAGDAARLRNGIRLVLIENSLDYYPVIEAVGNGWAAGGVVSRWMVRDQNALF